MPSKRVKFYHVPSTTGNQVRHTSFTLSSDKTSVRNSFVALSQAELSPPDIDEEATEDSLNQDLQSDDEFGGGHSSQPLKWNGRFFESTTLKDIGLRIQLCHGIGSRCGNPQPAQDDKFVVIHTNGVHTISVDFCACETAPSIVDQLLRSRLFPSKTKAPRSAATFEVLRQFQIISFESKLTAFGFYNGLSRLTNNVVSPPPDMYRLFLRMVREWRNLKMLKRAGRGHDFGGVRATAEGDCALLCPACPHPGLNLPDGWENAPEGRRWLYSLFVGIDANFKLKRKNVSSTKVDPSSSRGWSYFVEETKYKAFLEVHGNLPQERTTCSDYGAMVRANSKDTRFLDTTGAGTVDCIRHEMKRPNGVGDLQKGERFINMDYMFFNTMHHHKNVLKNVFVSYDIACQWNRKLWDRMPLFPDEFHIDPSIEMKFLIPKFHLPAHRPACHSSYSFNLTPHVGRTDGESLERGWSNTNSLGSSTKEMGPGSRRDTLDDHFGDMNWKKICGLGLSLLRRIKAAVPERNEHVSAFQELTRSLPKDSVANWKEAVEAWEQDGTKKNPFEFRGTAVGQATVKLALLQQESREIQQGANAVLDGTVSHSVFISMGLDLEESQRRLSNDISALGRYATDTQLGKVQEQKNTLQRKVDSWCAVQARYFPGLAKLRGDSACPGQPHQVSLWLPSAIGNKLPCDCRFYSFEWDLRCAQANDALQELRRNLQLRAHLYKQKDRFATGQQANTRANATISRVQRYMNCGAAQYRAAHNALQQLAPHLKKDSAWTKSFPELHDGDIRAMATGLDGESEGRRSLSWIWKHDGVVNDGDNLHDSLRIEWCKARARAQRWSEEVQLLLEEMRRVLRFLEWKASVWDTRADFLQCDLNMAEHTTDELLGSRLLLASRMDGVQAYAWRQANVQRELYHHCRNLWREVPSLVVSQVRREHGLLVDLDPFMVKDLSLAASLIK